MSGGIIIQRRALLVPVATDPAILDSLTDKQKTKVNAIAAKAPDATTEEDIKELASLIKTAVHS